MSGNNNSVIEFGFDDGKVIKTQGVDAFKQGKPGEKSKISIIAFKRYHDGVLAQKARDKQGPLTDEEKADFISRVDTKLAANLKKEVKDLTEVDRLDIKSPRFSFAFTHFNDGVGTIRCLSRHEGTTLVRPELCCDKFGDADQTVATVIMQYPVDDNFQVDAEDLVRRKHTKFFIWKLSAKKFKKVEGTYIDQRNDGRPVIDLNVTLDGDPKFQKQLIESASTAFWARDGFDPGTRAWILDQGLRAYKYVQNSLGFDLSKEKLIEKLGGQAQSAAALSSGEASAEQPKLIGSYDDLL